jgi:hypothetical protein
LERHLQEHILKLFPPLFQPTETPSLTVQGFGQRFAKVLPTRRFDFKAGQPIVTCCRFGLFHTRLLLQEFHDILSRTPDLQQQYGIRCPNIGQFIVKPDATSVDDDDAIADFLDIRQMVGTE